MVRTKPLEYRDHGPTGLIGDISHIEILGKHIIVLNSVKAAVQMLDKKGSIYSDRPVLTMCGELVGCKYSVPFLPYGDALRVSRGQLQRCIGTLPAIRGYQDIEELEFHKFLKRVYDRPEQLAIHIRR